MRTGLGITREQDVTAAKVAVHDAGLQRRQHDFEIRTSTARNDCRCQHDRCDKAHVAAEIMRPECDQQRRLLRSLMMPRELQRPHRMQICHGADDVGRDRQDGWQVRLAVLGRPRLPEPATVDAALRATGSATV